jgi:alkylation response protein AidB-like acyl-CoA dehydrogenase
VSAALLKRVRGLHATLVARAAAGEQARRLPDDVVEALRTAGCLRLLAPAWAGGSESCYTTALRVIETLAEADASVAWVISQTTLAQIILSYLPQPTLARLYEGGPDLRAVGVFAPKGRARRSAQGWRVSGRWPFASGLHLARWVYLQCLVVEGRRIVLDADGLPATRLVVLPADQVQGHDNWDALGLRGTGSHDVSVAGHVCAQEYTCALAEHDGRGEGLHALSLRDHAGLLIAAVAVGLAAGAIDDLAGQAAAGQRPTFAAQRLADDAVFLDRLGAASMNQRAARALLYSQAARVEAAAGGCALSAVESASLRATCHHVTLLAREALDAAYTLGRSASIWATSPLQRRLRDLHTATQHAWNSADFTRQLGAALLAQATPPAMRAADADARASTSDADQD